MAYIWANSVHSHPYADVFHKLTDTQTYTGKTYIGQFNKEMNGPDFPSPGYQNVHIWRCFYSDMTNMSPNYVEVWASQLFGDGTAGRDAAEPYAEHLAKRLGVLPARLRHNLWRMQVHYNGTTANAESLSHYFSVPKFRIDVRVAENKLEETMFHESIHAGLQQAGSSDGKGLELLGPGIPKDPNFPDVGIQQAWLDAVKADNGNYVTEYAMSNHGEDFAETGLFAWILKYRPERILEADRKTLRAYVPNRLKYFDDVVFPGTGVSEPASTDTTTGDTTTTSGAISFVGSSVGAHHAGPNFDIPFPSGVQQADVAVLIYNWAGNSNQTAKTNSLVQSGWTKRAQVNKAGLNYRVNVGVFTKAMGITPDTVATCVFDSGGSDHGASGVLHVLRGVNPSDPLGGSAVIVTSGDGSTRPNPGPVTPPAAGWAILVGGAGVAASPTAFSQPGDLSNGTNHFPIPAIPPANFSRPITGLGFKLDAAATQFDPAAWTNPTDYTNGAWVGVTLALKPAGGISAVVTARETNDTAFSNATVLVSARLSVRETNDTAVAAARVPDKARLSVIEADDTILSIAALGAAGAEFGVLNIDEDDDVAVSAAVSPITGLVSVIEPDDVSTASAAALVKSVLSTIEADDIVAALAVAPPLPGAVTPGYRRLKAKGMLFSSGRRITIE